MQTQKIEKEGILPLVNAKKVIYVFCVKVKELLEKKIGLSWIKQDWDMFLLVHLCQARDLKVRLYKKYPLKDSRPFEKKI